jgi:hypothetical protein
VGADAGAPATLHWLLWRLCSHICDPSHSLHWFLTRLWWQMLEPPHFLHRLRRRLWGHFFSGCCGMSCFTASLTLTYHRCCPAVAQPLILTRSPTVVDTHTAHRCFPLRGWTLSYSPMNSATLSSYATLLFHAGVVNILCHSMHSSHDGTEERSSVSPRNCQGCDGA